MLISTQHEDGVEAKLPDALWEQVVTQALPPGLYDAEALRKEFYVNPTGRFVIGGPVGDTGLTGRKIIVDTYGGFARHGGGAFSGKDPSKVDRSASYAARTWPRTSWPPGWPTGPRSRWPTRSASPARCPCSSRPSAPRRSPGRRSPSWSASTSTCGPPRLVEALNLRRPIYQQTAAYGHFGRDEPDFTWESTDKAAALRAAAGLG